ncbi:MAG TPA: ABC transporter permease [Actinocatenispora sp.]
MRRALHAEWTKLATARGTAWLIFGIVAATAALTAAVDATVRCTALGCDQDPTRLSLTGVQLGQAVVAGLAILAAGGEFGTGMIRTTLLAVPRRTTVLAAKATVVAGLTAAAGTVAVLASLLVARLVLPTAGFTAAHGHPLPSLTAGGTVRAAGGAVLYLVLVALIALATATLVRDSAVATGAVLALLYVPPVAVFLVSDPDWQTWLWRFSPMDTGLAILSTTHLADLPLTGWAGLAVTAGWAVALLLPAAALLAHRDP